MLPSYLDPDAASLRAGGRQGQRPQPVRIVIDVREFMSHLPAVLHQQGFEVVPVTLEVCPAFGIGIIFSVTDVLSRAAQVDMRAVNRDSSPQQ